MLKIGQYVLVVHGRWSLGFKLNGETVRTVDPNDVSGIQNDEPKTIYKASAGHPNTRISKKSKCWKIGGINGSFNA